jgi:hypothetical protein
MLVGVVSAAPCGVWVYWWTGDAEHRILVRTCARFAKVDEGFEVRSSQTNTKVDDNGWVEVTQACSPVRCPTLMTIPTFDGLAGDVEDLTVPAGTFHGAKRIAGQQGQQWWHPEVPLGGLLKATAGGELVLIGFGQTGAKEVFEPIR